jgi:hypothetical protein
MKKVIINSITASNEYRELVEEVEVIVDGFLIGSGCYGGEPEDNSRGRDYSWVEPLLKALAEKLGAKVEFEKINIKE